MKRLKGSKSYFVCQRSISASMFFLSSDKIELDYYKSDVKKLLNIWNNRIPDVIKNILSFMEGFKSLQNVSGGNFIIALKILKSIKKYIAHTQHKITDFFVCQILKNYILSGQYQNDSTEPKIRLVLKLPRFFPHRVSE